MKVALLYPKWTGAYGLVGYFAGRNPFPPLNLALLGGILEEKGHDVVIIDGEAGNIPMDKMVKTAIDQKPDLIGMSCYGPFFHINKDLAINIKKENPKIPIAIGGPHITIQKELGVKVGYSDHTLGIEIPVAAVAMGATVIEKHFTLDRTLPGPDHAASLEPHELKTMVAAIRNIEKAMGDGVKKPSPSEIKNIPIARKSIVAKKIIKKGERFSEENFTVKRPGTGISPMEWDAFLGKSADREYQMDEMIQ